MINIVLTKKEYKILLSYRELDEYRYSDEWYDQLYKDEKNEYIVDLYVTDKVSQKIMYFLQETSGNIYNHTISEMRRVIQQIIDNKSDWDPYKPDVISNDVKKYNHALGSYEENEGLIGCF